VTCFDDCASFAKISFTTDCKLQELAGLNRCVSLIRLAVPASVKVLDGFNNYDNLTEMNFEQPANLQETDSFQGCRVKKIKFHASPEVIGEVF
jgi:hypothetical protein